MVSQADRMQQLRTRLPRRRGSRIGMRMALLLLALVAGIFYWFELWPFSHRTAEPAPTDTPSAPSPVVIAREKPADPPKISSATQSAQAPASVPVPVKPPTEAEIRDAADRAQREIAAARNGDADGLRRVLGRWVIDERVPRATRDDWLKEARDLSRRVVFSASPMQHTTVVVVQQGDRLSDICTRLRRDEKLLIMPAFIELVNDVKSSRLRLKTPLKIPTEPLSVLVDKGEFRLYLLLGGVFLKDYAVGIGREQRTPEGRFTIHSKTKNPAWTDPETGKVLQFGDPGHIIGSRWMSLASDGARTGFGIHGTVDPGSIGKAESAGCVRMQKADVEELYDLVPQGAEVVIRP